MLENKSDITGLEIAVVGMSVRIPGADSTAQFWENLSDGRESITFFTDEELIKSGISRSILDSDNYVKAKGVLSEGMGFEPELFGYNYRESNIMDPQLRVYHECVLQALYDACYQPEYFDGSIGIYGGAGSNPLWGSQFFSGNIDSLAAGYEVVNFNSQEYFNTRIAHSLDFQGPAITVQTACSSSLVAIHLASQGLIAGDCDLALAGGVEMATNATLSQPDVFGYFHQEGMITSTDGHCKTFDAQASGTVFSDGAACVVLKRLEDAIEDGDNIVAVIKGSAINNDGRSKVGFTAPSVVGQVQVIQAAQEMAEVPAETVSYVEAHGTGTALGDPIEIAALTEAFSSDKTGFCKIGSVKSNVGHLGAAAGAVGFIKTVLSLKNQKIPASLFYDTPNPEIDFENSPFHVGKTLESWESAGQARRAGVSSFGIGGTNAHVVLEEYIADKVEDRAEDRQSKMFFLSATNEESLLVQRKQLVEFLRQNPSSNLKDVEYSLNIGRRALPKRQLVIANEMADVISGFSDDESPIRLGASAKNRKVVFLFPGQGSQYLKMGCELYLERPEFRKIVDHCFSVLDDATAEELMTLFMGQTEDAARINSTEFAQPLLFILEYSLAQYFTLLGISPWAMIGHSIGEYVAATISGVFELGDALALVALRGRLMATTSKGQMVVVSMPVTEVSNHLVGGLSIAAINTDESCVVSGDDELVTTFIDTLEALDVKTTLIPTDHAYHSSLMDPILDDFSKALQNMDLSEPNVPYISNVSGQWVTVEQATSPSYWLEHLRQTVRFSEGVKTISEDRNLLFIEMGPGRTLSSFVRKSLSGREGDLIVNLLGSRNETVKDEEMFTKAVARIHLNGNSISWQNYYLNTERKRLALPGYVFERLELKPDAAKSHTAEVLETGTHLDPQSARTYVPEWRRSEVARYSIDDVLLEHDKQAQWLIFMDDSGPAHALSSALRSANISVTTVSRGSHFKPIGDNHFEIDSSDPQSYYALFDTLQSNEGTAIRIAHFWSLYSLSSSSVADLDDHLNLGFYSLINIAKALGQLGESNQVRISVISSEMHSVSGEETLIPVKSTVMGAVRVISQEYPMIECQNIDLGRLRTNQSNREIAPLILSEICSEKFSQLVAYRGPYRWERSYQFQSAIAKNDNHTADLNGRIVESGHYLITGGLGGIGLALSETISQIAKVSFTLLSRRAFPKRNTWGTWLKQNTSTNQISRAILAIQSLEKNGSTVLIVQANIAIERELKEAIKKAEDSLGSINGVVHAAGIPSGAAIQFKPKQNMEQVLAAKVAGTQALSNVLLDQPLDFICLCSSVTSILGGFGQADYCAANAYLDACVYSDLFPMSEFTFSINWDPWKEVGMAVDVMNDGGIVRGQNIHPLLGSVGLQADDNMVFNSKLRPEELWALDEHKILEQATLPGTSYIEMARAAACHLIGDKPLEFSNIYFLVPLIIEAGQWRDVTTTLTKKAKDYEFSITSRLMGSGDSVEHAKGVVRPIDISDSDRQDIDLLWSRYQEQSTSELHRMAAGRAPQDNQQSSVNAITLGAHWDVFNRVAIGERAGIANLQLPNEFVEETSVYKVHPALLDCATAFLSSLVSAEFYFPLFYKNIKQYKSLTAECYSQAILVSGSDDSSDTLTLDISIFDTLGNLLMSVDGFSMKKMSDEAPTRSATVEVPEVIESASKTLDSGLLTSEAVRAFRQILSSNNRSVVLTKSNINEDIKQLQNLLTSEEIDQVDDRQLRARPELETAFVSPKSDVEKELATLWAKMLGVAEIGIYDNYFDLGGDSLTLMQIHSQLPAITDKNIALAELYNYYTIKSFADFIEEPDSNVDERLDKVDQRAQKMKSAIKRRRKPERRT